ncbi:CREB3 regulatory factor [Thelohanellus kitauei]|uniref:CREB3 regulatory factor n=1 Tax=Thelohanellus kitauei TaxID=669202 RepID=A0A0C2NJI2_THEKT|nr:CREB3 regulatory factor [Thelohanellus kitauei]
MNDDRQEVQDNSTLNYSPDTSLLLCINNEDATRPKRTVVPPLADRQFTECINIEEPTVCTEMPTNLPRFEETWNPVSQNPNLQNTNLSAQNMPFLLDQNQMNIMPMPEVLTHNMFVNTNFNPVHVALDSNQVESYGHVQNMAYVPGYLPKLGLHQPSIEECINNQTVNAFPFVQINYPMGTFGPGAQFPQRTPPEVCTNIYVNKASTKLSEAEDWTPNPHKLLEILSELEKLNEIICRLKDECDLPNAKPNLKRERNRLASKACRLKKKATHETNKIKLEGLEIEFKLLIYALHFMSWELISFVSYPSSTENLTGKLNDIQNKYLSGIKVAADSDNFVKNVLERTKNHDPRTSFILQDPSVQV